MIVKLSSKGRLVIPKAVRQTLSLHAGAELDAHIVDGLIVLAPVAHSPEDALYGIFADCDLLADLETEHREEVNSL